MIEHNDLSKPIYKRLKEMIRNGELKRGEKLVQERLAEALGVSRTPLRKALLALEKEYLVESIPRKGMYLRVLDYKEIIDIYVCREALEGMAVRLLAETKDGAVVAQLKACFGAFTSGGVINSDAYAAADEMFHSLLIKLTANKPLDNVYFYSKIHDKVVGHGLLRAPKQTLEEHYNIIDAIAEGDADKAEALIRLHIRTSKELLINQYKNQKSE